MNIEEIGKQLQEIQKDIEEATASLMLISDSIDEMTGEKDSSLSSEEEEVKAVRAKWSEKRKKYDEQMDSMKIERNHLDNHLTAQRKALDVATTCFRLAMSRLDPEEVSIVLDDLEKAETPDFKSAKDTLFPKDPHEEDTESEEQTPVAATG